MVLLHSVAFFFFTLLSFHPVKHFSLHSMLEFSTAQHKVNNFLDGSFRVFLKTKKKVLQGSKYFMNMNILHFDVEKSFLLQTSQK